jgi:hypothetical protein
VTRPSGPLGGASPGGSARAQALPAQTPALAELTMRLLAKGPAGRPPGAAAVASTLAALERAEAGRPAAGRRRRRLAWALAACLLLLAAGAGGVLLGPAVYRFTTDRGEVVIETDDPDVEVTVRGPEIRILDTRTNRAVTLKSGKYQVELSRGQAGLRLSAREFTLERAGKQIVKVSLPKGASPPKGTPAVPARWKPGPGDSGLTGLVARPARLPGVRRWQATTTAPGGQTRFVAWSRDGQRLVCGGQAPYLRVYERASGRLVQVLDLDDLWSASSACTRPPATRSRPRSGGRSSKRWRRPPPRRRRSRPRSSGRLAPPPGSPQPKLPEAERREWQGFWSEVDGLLRKAEGKKQGP